MLDGRGLGLSCSLSTILERHLWRHIERDRPICRAAADDSLAWSEAARDRPRPGLGPEPAQARSRPRAARRRHALMALAADRVYESVGALAADLRAQLAAL